jgi:F-type H+-transporting ATPase subunit b
MAMQTENAMPSAPGHEPGVADAHEGTAAAGGHESAGLPQFDFTWWPGQILWFLIIFFAILAFMRLFAVPRVGGAIEEREGYITNQIAEARRMKDEADAEAQAATAEAAQARANAQKVALDARTKAGAEVAARLAEEEAKLAATGAEAERRIAASRDAAMTNVQAIATDAAGAIVKQLTGQPATAAELATARG